MNSTREQEGSNSEGKVVTIHANSRNHRHHREEEALAVSPTNETDHDPSGYKRRLAEEIVGAHLLGQKTIGHKKRHLVHIVAEALGAATAVKDAGGYETELPCLSSNWGRVRKWARGWGRWFVLGLLDDLTMLPNWISVQQTALAH